MRDSWIGSNATRLERASSAALMKRPSGPVARAGVVALVMMIAVLPLAALSGCRTQRTTTEPYEQQCTMFGTLVTIKVDETATPRVKNAVARAFAEMARVEKLANNYDPNSAISILNAGKTLARKVPRELADLVWFALLGARGLSGTFDPTIWPVVRLWGFGRANRVPTSAELTQAVKLVGRTNAEVFIQSQDARTGTVLMHQPGMGIDLGGIAKGYAVDSAGFVLRAAGIRHALITAGSSTLVFGGKTNGSPWKIGIENPRSPGRIIGVISLKDGAVGTSGDYQNYFVRDGVRYHHILDPRTGTPARRALSATVIIVAPPAKAGSHDKDRASDMLSGSSPWPRGTISDIVSTAAFVMGPDRTAKTLEESPGALANAASVVFVTPDRRVRTLGKVRGIVSGLPPRI